MIDVSGVQMALLVQDTEIFPITRSQLYVENSEIYSVNQRGYSC